MSRNNYSTLQCSLHIITFLQNKHLETLLKLATEHLANANEILEEYSPQMATIFNFFDVTVFMLVQFLAPIPCIPAWNCLHEVYMFVGSLVLQFLPTVLADFT